MIFGGTKIRMKQKEVDKIEFKNIRGEKTEVKSRDIQRTYFKMNLKRILKKSL